MQFICNALSYLFSFIEVVNNLDLVYNIERTGAFPSSHRINYEANVYTDKEF